MPRLVGSFTSTATSPKLTGLRHESMIGFAFLGIRSGGSCPPQIVLPALGVPKCGPLVPGGELRVAVGTEGFLLHLRERPRMTNLARLVGLGEAPRRSLQLALQSNRLVGHPVAELLVVLPDQPIVRAHLRGHAGERGERRARSAPGKCCYEQVHREVGATGLEPVTSGLSSRLFVAYSCGFYW